MYSQKADLSYCKYLLNYNTDQHEISGQYWTTKMCPAMQCCDVTTNPRWRKAAILKIAKSPYLSQKSSDFDEIWYTISDIEPDYSHMTKN